jgi:hypothetical protein
VRALLSCAAVLALCAPAAHAAGYELVDRSPDATLESGELRSQFVVLRNTGAATWTDVTLSGTLLNEDAFAPVTAPGGLARIEFNALAPEVTAPTTIHGQVTASSAGWTGDPVTIDYRVLPAEYPVIAGPPDIGFSADNATISVAADVTDNAALERVEIVYAGQTVVPVPDGRIYRASFLAQSCANLIIRATDRANHTSETRVSGICIPYVIPVAPPPPVKPTNATIVARWHTSRRGTTVSVLRVKALPEGGTVVVTCHGGGCPFTFKRVALPAGRDTSLLALFRHARLRPRAVVEVRAVPSEPGTATTLARYTVRKGHAPAAKVICFTPGPGNGSACG